MTAPTSRTARLIVEPEERAATIACPIAAPREQVFEVYTNPDLVPDWWGRSDDETVVDEMNIRPGGTWRYRSQTGNGDEYAFYGVYYDVTAPERIAQTFGMDGMPGVMQLQTVVFDETDEGTTLRVHVVYPTVADRDRDLEAGSEGAIETMDRLRALVEAS